MFKLFLKATIPFIFSCYSLLARQGEVIFPGDSIKETKRYGIWFEPTKINKVYGICLSVLSTRYFYIKENHVVNGLSIIPIGTGYFVPAIFLNQRPFKKYYDNRNNPEIIDSLKNEIISLKDSLKVNKHDYNGLQITYLGTYNNKMNGVQIGGSFGLNIVANGLIINWVYNTAFVSRGVSIGMGNSSLSHEGVQIGFINTTVLLKGVQIGLWNINSKRSLPFINWNFKDK